MARETYIEVCHRCDGHRSKLSKRIAGVSVGGDHGLPCWVCRGSGYPQFIRFLPRDNAASDNANHSKRVAPAEES